MREHAIEKKLAKFELKADDREALNYILKSVSSTKAEWNYLIIFVFSAIALLYGIITDFLI